MERRRRRFRRPVVVLVVLVLLLTSAATVRWWQARHPPSSMSIPDGGERPWEGAWPGPVVAPAPPAGQPPYVSSVDPETRRHFLDQYGRPLLVRGDSPWSMITDLGRDDVIRYLDDRRRHGVNALIVSMLGATANGGPADDGSTFDGVRPFTSGVQLNPAYVARVREDVDLAAARGMTVFLYPFDVWTLGRAFRPDDVADCRSYGTQIADALRGAPNLAWMGGGDYDPSGRPEGSDADHCYDAVVRGLRAAGAAGLFSMQLNGVPSTSDRFWAARVEWDFVYTYGPTYRQVRQAWGAAGTRPVVLGEANYEGENNQPGTPTTTLQTLRRQFWWTMSSGGAGVFFGTQDWNFDDGWQGRLSSAGIVQFGASADLIDRLRWWQWAPSPPGSLITAGTGRCEPDDPGTDVLDSDCATAAVAADGSSALVYLPTARLVTIDTSRLDREVEASWIDPTDATRTPARSVRSAGGATFTPPGSNAAGDGDWLLLFDAGGA